MSHEVLTPLRRINGRLQACDPCRARKVSCDHGRPVCLRCRKKRQDRHCVYTVSLATLPSPKETTVLHSPFTIPISDPLDGSASLNPRLATGPVSRGHDARAPGYLGYTSYSTVIEEARNTLAILSGTAQEAPQDIQSDSTQSFMSPKILQVALIVLRHVPGLEDGATTLRDVQTVYHNWALRIARGILVSLYEPAGFSKYLGKNRTVAQLKEMAQILCNNTAKPILDDLAPDQWLSQFSGPNLRWESLGLLFVFWELSKTSTGSQPHVRQNFSGRRSDPQKLDCLSLCIKLCREFSDGNLFLVYLHVRRTTLESYSSGDASRRTWKSHAEAVASMTFIGLHAEPNSPPSLPSELKRRVAVNILCMDTVITSFTGRPPLLNKRYTTTPLPLDIKDDYLFSDKATLHARVADTLDERGWNTEGGIYSSTYSRSRGMLAIFKGQATEIALEPTLLIPIEDLLQMKAKLKQTIAEFPQALTYRAEELIDPDFNPSLYFTRLLLRLDYLQIEFLLSRLLMKKGYDAESDLLATSFETVVLTLTLWTHMDRFAVMRIDFEWLLVGYGAPAGGILCKELLKPTLHGSHPKNPDITRSSIIQKLSLLVGFLEWPDPSAPNGNLCSHCKSVIQRVLDQTLNPTQSGGSVASDMLDWDFSNTQLDFDFDLINTFDWMRTNT